jgi:hypothetical protein
MRARVMVTSRGLSWPLQYGLVYTARFGNGRLGAVAHDRDGFARHHELPQINGYPFHPSEQDMISAADIKDQIDHNCVDDVDELALLCLTRVRVFQAPCAA